MKFDDVKKWWPIVPITLSLSAAYVAIWMDRVGCETTPYLACWMTAVAHRFADMLWLGWLKNYQDLVGGLAALAAAAAVLWTARQDRLDRSVARTVEQTEYLETSLVRLKRAALRLEFAANTSGDLERLRLLVDSVRAASEALPRSAHSLSVQTTINCNACDAYLDLIERNGEEHMHAQMSRLEIQKIAFVLATFMTLHERLNENGQYVHRPRLLNADKIQEAAGLGITRDSEEAYITLFIEFPD